ncbi:alpha-L-fucosidase [Labilibacter marinus]|uniref:alpha-L-fucosidase n=1 Tax=Labilibacter marinus TaxID=1477105 RepID=UPI0009502876|nr:alpha-L-fucosidase [Labilibacter marinus]
MSKIMFSIVLFFLMSVCCNAQDIYTDSWESLQNYEAPEWYEDAKLGFWPIWGVYSVPAFKGDHAAEWYGRWMYCQKDQSSRNNQALATHLYHNKTYGPPEEFGYKDFIPMFTAEKFNAKEWISLCKEGGAKYFTTLAVFHDAFCMWNSPTSKWNSVEMGPKRDIVAELASETRKQGLKFGVSNHSAWNYAFFQWNHINRYDAINADNQDLYGTPIVAKSADTVRIAKGEGRKTWIPRSRGLVQPSQRDFDRWLERTKEVSDLYKPDLHYFDWGFNPTVWEPYRQQFGAFYYNNAIEAGKGEYGKPNVVINYKGWSTWKEGAAVRDFEHGAFDDIHNMVWQTDESIYFGHNWGYAEGIEIKPVNMVIDQFMDVISKRGVLMLAIAPKADGTFPEDQKQFIRQMGAWLKICGEAVYATRPYEVFGELGDRWNERDHHNQKKYETTPEDIRFTRNKANTILYATALEWPGETMLIKTLATADLSQLENVSLIGSKKKLKWKQTPKGLEITMPNEPDYKFAYPVKLEFKRKVPSSKE